MFVIERIAHFSRNLNQYTGTIIMIMQYCSKFKLKVLTSLAQGNVVLSEIVGVVKDESLLLVLRMPELMLGLNFKIFLKSAGDKV